MYFCQLTKIELSYTNQVLLLLLSLCVCVCFIVWLFNYSINCRPFSSIFTEFFSHWFRLWFKFNWLHLQWDLAWFFKMQMQIQYQTTSCIYRMRFFFICAAFRVLMVLLTLTMLFTVSVTIKIEISAVKSNLFPSYYMHWTHPLYSILWSSKRITSFKWKF